MDPSSLGRVLMVMGALAMVVGGVFFLIGRSGVGSIPGDLRFGRGNVRFYLPIGTSILISILLTLLLNLFLRRR